MTKKRRRGILSDWILVLRESRNAKRLRRELPSPSNEATRIRSDNATPQIPTTQSVSRDHDFTPEICKTHTASCVRHNLCHEDDPDIPIGSPEEIDESSHPALVTTPPEDEEDYGLHPHQNEFQPFQVDDWDVNSGQFEHTPTGAEQSGNDARQEEEPCAGQDMQWSTSPTADTRCRSPDHIDDTDEEPDMELLLRMRRKWEGHLHLSAVLAIVGSVRYTVEHYEYTRNILLDELPGSGQDWPPYSRTQRYFKEILGACLPESHIVPLPRKSTCITDNAQYAQFGPALGEPLHSNDSGNNLGETENVRIFLPSAWAQLDVAISVVFDAMFNAYHINGEGGHDIERSRIISQRRMVTSACEYIYVTHEDQSLPCVPGSNIMITVKREPPRIHTAFQITTGDCMYKFHANIVGTWSIGAKHHPTPSAEQLIDQDFLTQRQRTIISHLSTAHPRPPNPDGSEPDNVLPGDICTLLSSGRRTEPDEYDAVTVHRFWRYRDGTPSVLLLWIFVPNADTEETGTANNQAEIGVCDIVSHINLRRYRAPIDSLEETTPRSHGRLADGTRYVVYRILLYCDDFRKSTQHYPTGSAGGCYFLPLSLPPEARRSTSSVRIISLTPPGVSTNQVLHHIVDDLVHATICGVDGHTPDGARVKIFIDVVGFVGDYPAAAGTVDVIGHVGRAPCTLCTFRRPHASEAEGSRYGHTTTVHAGNSTFLRHAERHLSVRQSGVSSSDANILGMVDNTRADGKSCPLMHLRNELHARQSCIPRNVSGESVVTGLFDPYRCNPVAPDHLLTGLSKDILNTVFQCLPTKKMRKQVDTYICAALRGNGLLLQRQAFNLDTKTLHSMTLSELYSVVIVAAPTVKIVTCSCPAGNVANEATQLLGKLQLLIAHTYWWPRAPIDGAAEEDIVRFEHDGYFSELKDESKRYVKSVNNFCETFQEHSEQLDKPNLHRLIELYEHSIPAFGHVREFMELVFESAHQPLKRCIGNSNNHNSHIFATEHSVGNDWQGRIASLSRELRYEDESRQLKARRGIRRLLLGKDADKLDETRDKEFIAETDVMLRRLLTNAVMKSFSKDGRISNFAMSKKSFWRGRGKSTLNDLSKSLGVTTNLLERIVQIAIEGLSAVFPPVNGESSGRTEDLITLCKAAKRVKVSDNGRQVGKPSGFDMVYPNCVVRAYIPEG